tara:strand:+ start:1011 stop:1619 length:609 start_codon:yes stop_codon:yes gene_type:complete
MATIASNQLGVYAIDGGSISPLQVYEGAIDATGTSLTPGKVIVIDPTSKEFLGFATVAAGDLSAITIATGDLCAAATTTTLDTSNTINEVAARNGIGSSTNFIASGAFSWNFSLDGLMDLTSVSGGNTGTPVTILDLSKASKYVLVRFTTKIGTSGLGDVTGVVSYVGQALIESASITGGVDDIATYSATFRGYGDLYKEVA